MRTRRDTRVLGRNMARDKRAETGLVFSLASALLFTVAQILFGITLECTPYQGLMIK